MNVAYDPESGAKYIQIRQGSVVETKPQSEWLLFDCDHTGEVVGIEILDAHKHPITVSTFEDRLIEILALDADSIIQTMPTAEKEGLRVVQPVPSPVL